MSETNRRTYADFGWLGSLRQVRRAFAADPSVTMGEMWRHFQVDLARWRDLFAELTPGYTEFLDQYEHLEEYGPLLDGPLGEELRDYSREELLTVNAVYGWRKPG